MKVFLIGGNGFLGSATAEELIRRGHTVHAISLSPCPEGAVLPAEMKLEYKNYLQLSDDEIRAYFSGCEGFVFASGVDERIEGPSPIYDFYKKYNIVPLERLLRIAKECGVKHTVICGSYFTYFNRIWPKMELSRWHPYIRSRADQEEMALSFADDQFSVAILELPYIFGIQPGREPVWTIIVKMLRNMKKATMYPKGGTTMVTRKQVGQAMAGALEITKGGQCWPIGWYYMPWTDFLSLVHNYMGMEGRKIITIPNWMVTLGMKFMEKKSSESNKEGGMYMPKFAEIQSAQCYIDKSMGCAPLGVEDDNITSAIKESIQLSVAVLDGKVKNIVRMRGE